MRLSIVYKLSISTVTLVLVAAGVVGTVFYTKTSEILVRHSLDDISANVQDAGNMLKKIVRSHNEDVLVLSSVPPIQGILRARSSGGVDDLDTTNYSQWVARLERIFNSYLERKLKYLEIRFIDKDGWELVTVTRKGSRIRSLKGVQLQNTKHLNFVRETLKLPVNSVYISEINLNREFGKVIIPHQEIVRGATPVYDEKTGGLAGLVVITAELGADLRTIQQRFQKNNNNIYITNDRGSYLLNPLASRTYGFDLEKRYRIQEDIPLLAKLFLPGSLKQQVTIIPNQDDNQNVVSFTKINFDESRPERFISVAITQDFATITAEQSSVLNDVVLWAALLTLCGTGITILFSIGITRPIKQMTSAVDDFAQLRPTTTKLPISRNDEIGLLARSFESMIKQVSDSQKSLEDLNENLEEQVVKRTRLLNDSEDQQRTILQAIADAVITIDESGLITSFNPAAENVFGYRNNEVVGKNVAILLPEGEQQEHINYTKNSTLYAPRIISQARFLKGLRKNGAIFPLELNVAPIYGKERSGFVGILRDITERKKTEEEIISAKQQAERANAAKSEFLSRMSHELRTPMNAILGFGQMLELDAEGFNDTQKGNVQEILAAGHHLLSLINEVLDMARIESGKMEISVEKVVIDDVLQQCLSLIQTQANEKEIKLIEHIIGTGHTVQADFTRLKQILLNILSNAIKYNRDNGSITLDYEIINKKKLRINITDTGKGLSNEEIGRLFLPFERLGEENNIEGTGIGLVITKHLAELMGGAIGVKSVKGEGSTFWVELLLIND